MNHENETGVNAWKVLALALTVILAAMACMFFILRDNPDSSGEGNKAKTEVSAGVTDSAKSAQTQQPGEAATTGGETTEAGTGSTKDTGNAEDNKEPDTVAKSNETYPCRFTFADCFQHTRVVGTTVYFMEGKDNPAGEVMRSLRTDKMGRVSIDLPAGDYTLVFGDDNYYDGMENITIGGPDGPGHDFISDSDEEYEFWKFLLPRQGGNALCLVLEWKGKDDLDLCVFNAGLKRYITSLQPNDEQGCYLVEDDGAGSPGWEVVVIQDYTKSDVYTPFIRDGNNLMRGSLSAMEANGVRLSILDHNGLVFSKQADPAEHAALWMPCYILKGKVIRDEVYEYEPSRYAWAAYAKQ